MENVQDGCYLWGCLVTDRSDTNLLPAGYRAFVTWEQMTPEVEAENSLRFWQWLTNARDAVHIAGRTFRTYCFSAGAENRFLRRLGSAGQIEEQVESFIDSEDWVDMSRVWDSQLITGGSTGLKTVAPMAGYQWVVDDPGGDESIVKYDLAVSELPDSSSAREWLIEYNRGDVEATRAVRLWMERADIPSIEDLGP